MIWLLGSCCGPPDSAAGADALNRWVGGKWVGSGQFVDTAYSKAIQPAPQPNALVSDHVFVVLLTRTLSLAASPCAHLFPIYTFSPKTSRYYFYGISLGEETGSHTALDITEQRRALALFQHE